MSKLQIVSMIIWTKVLIMIFYKTLVSDEPFTFEIYIFVVWYTFPFGKSHLSWILIRYRTDLEINITLWMSTSWWYLHFVGHRTDPNINVLVRSENKGNFYLKNFYNSNVINFCFVKFVEFALITDKRFMCCGVFLCILEWNFFESFGNCWWQRMDDWRRVNRFLEQRKACSSE